MNVNISANTTELVDKLFAPRDREQAVHLLAHQCGSNLPGLERLAAGDLERWHFAALKLSRGQLGALKRAVQLANADWRDLLVAAGFADDVKAHEIWLIEMRRTLET